MEVGYLDSIVIDDNDAAYSRAYEILQHRTAETARANDQHRCSCKARLTLGPDFAQHRLAGIAVAHDGLVAGLVAAIHVLACPSGSA